MSRLSIASVLAVLLGSLPPAGADTFRCGQRIATTDMSVEELLDACGEPTSRSVEEIDVYGPNVHGAGNVKRGTITVERWTYDRGPQAFAMVVTIEDGVIKSIERAK
jgi:hypothetical protein